MRVTIKLKRANLNAIQLVVCISVMAILIAFSAPKFLEATEQGKPANSEEKTNGNIPTLSWEKKHFNDFGYTQYGSETQITVHDNGDAQIAIYNAETPYVSHYNKATGEWKLGGNAWWYHGVPDILWAGDGVFLARITGYANIIASKDGIIWRNAGYCEDAQNSMTAGAYDVDSECGIVSWWYYKSPLYYSFDSLTERTAWVPEGSDGISVPVFKYLTAHKGQFVGVVSNDNEIAVADPSNPGAWTTTIQKDEAESAYMYPKSVHEKLFVMKWRYDGEDFHVKLCVLNDDATKLTETNLSHVGDLADNNIPSPQNIIWMEDWGKYALFKEGMLYVSEDGLNWEGVKQEGFTTDKYETFGGAIYVPGDGFYVNGNDYVYYAPYK